MNIKYVSYALLLTTVPLIFGMNEHHSQKIRKQLESSSIDQIKKIGAGKITIKERIPLGTRYGICHNYAMSKIMGIVGKVPKVFKNVDGYAKNYYGDEYINMKEHTDPIDSPQAGDIIIYLSDNGPLTNTNQITHTGIMTENGTVESKWGIIRAVFEHPIWLVPEDYGNSIFFARPNKTGTELLNAVQERLTDPSLKEILDANAHDDQQLLFHYAANASDFIDLNGTTKYTFIPTLVKCIAKNIYKSLNSTYHTDEIYELLEGNMSVHPGKSDKKGRTALMLAAKAGDISSIDLLLLYKKNINTQDEEGNTALMHAAMNNKITAEQTLIDWGANQDVKNHLGLTAKHYAKISRIDNFDWTDVYS